MKGPTLNVVTIRNRGVDQNVAAILAGAGDEGVLMAKDKVRLDTSYDGPKVTPDKIEIRVFEDGVQTGSFKGDTLTSQMLGRSWELTEQGIFGDSHRPVGEKGGLQETLGYTFMLRWNGWGPGTTSAGVQAVHDGVEGAVLGFPKAD